MASEVVGPNVFPSMMLVMMVNDGLGPERAGRSGYIVKTGYRQEPRHERRGKTEVELYIKGKCSVGHEISRNGPFEMKHGERSGMLKNKNKTAKNGAELGFKQVDLVADPS